MYDEQINAIRRDLNMLTISVVLFGISTIVNAVAIIIRNLGH